MPCDVMSLVPGHVRVWSWPWFARSLPVITVSLLSSTNSDCSSKLCTLSFWRAFARFDTRDEGEVSSSGPSVRGRTCDPPPSIALDIPINRSRSFRYTPSAPVKSVLEVEELTIGLLHIVVAKKRSIKSKHKRALPMALCLSRASVSAFLK